MKEKLLAVFGYAVIGLIGLAVLAGLGVYLWGSSYTYDPSAESEQKKLQADMPKVKAQVEECISFKESAELAGRSRSEAINNNGGTLPSTFRASSVDRTIARYEALRATCDPLITKYEQEYSRLVHLAQESARNKKNAFEKWLSRNEEPSVETFQFKAQYKACFPGCRSQIIP